MGPHFNVPEARPLIVQIPNAPYRALKKLSYSLEREELSVTSTHNPVYKAA